MSKRSKSAPQAPKNNPATAQSGDIHRKPPVNQPFSLSSAARYAWPGKFDRARILGCEEAEKYRAALVAAGYVLVD